MEHEWVKLNVSQETRQRIRVLKARRGDPDMDHTVQAAIEKLEVLTNARVD